MKISSEDAAKVIRALKDAQTTDDSAHKWQRNSEAIAIMERPSEEPALAIFEPVTDEASHKAAAGIAAEDGYDADGLYAAGIARGIIHYRDSLRGTPRQTSAT